MLKDLKSKQSFTIAAITFWGQFATYSFNAILILYLTKSVMEYGIGFSESYAYSFQGIYKAMNYAIIMFGGYIADRYLGLRRSIFLGSLLLAFGYLTVFLSGFFVKVSNEFFIFAFALIPVCGSLQMGTASAMVSKIYSEDPVNAKGAMTLFYISINLGSLLAFIIAPMLIGYKFGALAVLSVVFVGKLLAITNFAYRYKIYNNVVDEIDKNPMTTIAKQIVISYLIIVYIFTLICYHYPDYANIVVAGISMLCLILFLLRTIFFLGGDVRIKQIVGLILIIVAVVFFVIYNQMESTLVMAAKNNSDLLMFGFKVNAASYQMVNPILIIFGGMLLIRIYPMFPRFYIPYQFAVGVLLAAAGLFIMYYGFSVVRDGIVNGNYITFSYVLISISELFVSAIGLSMIGIYCDNKTIGFAMGAWYISSSMANSITGLLNQVVALPKDGVSALESANMYQAYFFDTSVSVMLIGLLVLILAYFLIRFMKIRNIDFV
ncbi:MULTISPECIES: peptide MFS transporter [Francisella]|uniref:Peptide transporter n=1 Tax=Francisella opportunistica TaxID=2016517 RepID=A0A345JRT6_9GAMM|nr:MULTISPECIES: peptide MFS transporter [Francisella]APC91781.1 Di/tripeptide permease DtpT [Francisella sp. MA067296]AXH30032.1 peptide transporter [Francisella opportunistica]AXH31676.1 peptide transporter [Francisella opportunistica]AXH33322.1 peptide transporter [Francisella opportunistica]